MTSQKPHNPSETATLRETDVKKPALAEALNVPRVIERPMFVSSPARAVAKPARKREFSCKHKKSLSAAVEKWWAGRKRVKDEG